MLRFNVILTFLAVIFLSLLSALKPIYGQQSDRAIITGLVTDATGSGVPDSVVTITNEATNSKTVVTTTSAGNYSTPPLILGTYTVQVEKAGFSTFVRTGVILTGGATYRQDAKLELGAVTQKVEVNSAADLVNVETPEVSHTIGEKYYQDLPVVMGSDIRMAEAQLYLQPGFVPMRPNGDPIFRGSQFESRMNGGQTMATENFLDGASFGSAIDHNGTQERSVPYEAVQEMKVIDSTFSAQYGRTSGGFIEYTTKSGTSQYHGTLYDYHNDNHLNARGELIGQIPVKISNSYGFALGGPVWIPKIFNHKDKVFFFTDLDFLNLRQGALPSFGNTNPLSSFKQGDFSALLDTSKQLGTDALGRPIFQGQVFNPTTTRQVNGIPVRDGFGFTAAGLPIPGQANIIPASFPLRSAIAAKLVPLIPDPDRPGLTNNSIQPAGNAKLDVKTWVIRVDVNVTSNLKAATTYNWNDRPSLRQCASFSKGCTAQSKETYFGEGFYQDISTKTFHQQFDWVIRPNLFNHTTLGYDYWIIPSTPQSSGGGWIKRLGLKGPTDDTGGAPRVGLSSGLIPYSHYGNADATGFTEANRWQFLDDITWIKGNHTIKAGFEYRFHLFPINGNGNLTGSYNFSNRETAGYDAKGNQLATTGDPVASFLLGQVDNASFNINFHPRLHESYLAPWVNDEVKIGKKLTLNIGLRFDYQTALHESQDRLSSFSPTTPNPGAGGRPGAIVFAGTGAGRIGQGAFEHPNNDAWGPRFGFAYRATEHTVVRGGYGIYYGGIATDQFTGQPTLGYSNNPTAPNVTNGLSPAFYWDDGFPQSAIKQPPFIDPTIGNGQGPLYITSDSRTLPRYQNWSLSVQRQIGANLLADATYIGSHGTRLITSGQALGLLANMNDPKILALGADVLNADISSQKAADAGIGPPYPGFTGSVAQALRPYPQYQRLNFKNVPIGASVYHSLQLKVEKRFSMGLIGRVAYTWSKLINDGAEQGLAGAEPGFVQNPLAGHKDGRSLSYDDIPHSLIIAYSYELPFGKGKKFLNSASGGLDRLVRGWSIAAVQRYDAGRPLAISMANDLGGLLFNNVKRPNKVAPGDAYHGGHFDPNKDLYLLKAGWSDPGPLQFGNASRTDPTIRNFHYFNEDLNLFKNTYITERVNLRFEAQLGNALNRHLWCDPNTNWSSSDFGKVFAQCDTPRQLQLGLKLQF